MRKTKGDPRTKPSARHAPHPNTGVRNKPIVLVTGRGDSRLTIEEACDLQRSLRDAIVAALSGPQPHAADMDA